MKRTDETDPPDAWRRDWSEGRDSPYQVGTVPDLAWRFGRELHRKDRADPIGLGSGLPGQGAARQDSVRTSGAFGRRLGLDANPLARDTVPSPARPAGQTDPVEPSKLNDVRDVGLGRRLANAGPIGLPGPRAPRESADLPFVEKVAHEVVPRVRPEPRYPEGLPAMAPFLSKHELRSDARGDGKFWALRDGGVHDHQGYDILATPGETLRSPLSGRIKRFGQTKKGGANDILDIESDDGRYTVRLFYAAPNKHLRLNDRVEAGEAVGSVLVVSERYGGGMKDHVHVELWDCAHATRSTGRPGQDRHCTLMDPTPWIRSMQ